MTCTSVTTYRDISGLFVRVFGRGWGSREYLFACRLLCTNVCDESSDSIPLNGLNKINLTNNADI